MSDEITPTEASNEEAGPRRPRMWIIVGLAIFGVLALLAGRVGADMNDSGRDYSFFESYGIGCFFLFGAVFAYGARFERATTAAFRAFLAGLFALALLVLIAHPTP